MSEYMRSVCPHKFTPFPGLQVSGDQTINKLELELCPYPWIRELREPTKLVLLTLHLYAFTQATLC